MAAEALLEGGGLVSALGESLTNIGVGVCVGVYVYLSVHLSIYLFLIYVYIVCLLWKTNAGLSVISKKYKRLSNY